MSHVSRGSRPSAHQRGVSRNEASEAKREGSAGAFVDQCQYRNESSRARIDISVPTEIESEAIPRNRGARLAAGSVDGAAQIDGSGPPLSGAGPPGHVDVETADCCGPIGVGRAQRAEDHLEAVRSHVRHTVVELRIDFYDRSGRCKRAVAAHPTPVDIVVAGDGARKVQEGALRRRHQRRTELSACAVRPGAVFDTAQMPWFTPSEGGVAANEIDVAASRPGVARTRSRPLRDER